MDNTGPTDDFAMDLTLAELRQQLREARIDRDGWHIQARLSNSHLQRILRSPAWRLTKPFRIINVIAWKFKPELHDDSDDPWSIVKSGETVWQAIGSLVTIEASNADLEASRIAVIAHWSEIPKISTSVNALIDELLLNSYEVVLVSACESKENLEFSDNQQEKITVLRKPNYGYDFGSWSVAVSLFPQVMSANEVLILNDSNAGPFGSTKDILDKMSNSPYDITGITDSLQIRYHIQSYMMHFKNGALMNDAVSKFWREIYSQDEKMGVIQAYELGLTSRAQSNGLRVGAIFPWNLITDYWENPSIHGAERLIELGFPFVKREALRNLSPIEKIRLAKIISKRFSIGQSAVTRMVEGPIT